MQFHNTAESFRKLLSERYAYISWKSNLDTVIAEQYTDQLGQPLVHMSRESFSPEVGTMPVAETAIAAVFILASCQGKVRRKSLLTCRRQYYFLVMNTYCKRNYIHMLMYASLNVVGNHHESPKLEIIVRRSHST